MDYQLKEFTSDRYYVGLKYESAISSIREIDLPSFWTEFTEQFFATEVSHLVQKEEAIGYMRSDYTSTNDLSYHYYAACEVTEFGETGNFEKITIPKGRYLFFTIRFEDKENEIDAVQTFITHHLSNAYKINEDFCMEYYPETFHHEDPNTKLFFVVPLR